MTAILSLQPCNPAVGGPAKSQLVHEVDALGGEIGKMADRCYLQKRVLNASKVTARPSACTALQDFDSTTKAPKDTHKLIATLLLLIQRTDKAG